MFARRALTFFNKILALMPLIDIIPQLARIEKAVSAHF